MANERIIPIQSDGEPEPNGSAESGALGAVQAQLQRALADCDNLRKRLDREVARRVEDDRVRFVLDLLPALDSLERALEAHPDPSDPWRQGTLAIAQQINEALARSGVERIESAGEPFDPRWHEAVGTIPGGEAGTIVQVIRPGYRLGERLIRAPRVLVAG